MDTDSRYDQKVVFSPSMRDFIRPRQRQIYLNEVECVQFHNCLFLAINSQCNVLVHLNTSETKRGQSQRIDIEMPSPNGSWTKLQITFHMVKQKCFSRIDTRHTSSLMTESIRLMCMNYCACSPADSKQLHPALRCSTYMYRRNWPLPWPKQPRPNPGTAYIFPLYEAKWKSFGRLDVVALEYMAADNLYPISRVAVQNGDNKSAAYAPLTRSTLIWSLLLALPG